MTKLDASGAALGYSTYLGGTGTDCGNGIALDTAGSAYLTGNTYSADFPTTPGAFDTTYNDASDVFVTKLDANGAALGYSTYLGGSDNIDSGRGIAIDSAGSAYLTGNTASHDFPTTPDAFDTTLDGDIDASERSSTQAAPPSSIPPTWAVGNDDIGSGIVVDSAGNAYLDRGYGSADFPTSAGAFDRTFNGGDGDVFVTKLDLVAGPPPPPHHRHRLHHRPTAAATATATASTASTATAAASASASTSSTASTAAACCPVRGAEGDRPDASQGPHADPCEALLCRSHPPCSLEASGPCACSEPEAGKEARTRRQGEPSGRPQIAKSGVPFRGRAGSSPAPGTQAASERSTRSTTTRAIARLDVAPGDGAFRTCVTEPSSSNQKSSSSCPSSERAWARTPEGPGRMSAARISGTSLRRSLTSRRLLSSPASSFTPERQ